MTGRPFVAPLLAWNLAIGAAAFAVIVGLLPTGASAQAIGPVLPGLPAPDDGSIYTVRVENDTVANTDRYYTSGIQAGWTGPTGLVPTFLANAGHAVLGVGDQRVSIDISQSLYTPSDTQIRPPDPHDRPYAAVLVVTGQLIQDTDLTRTRIGAQLGVLGPDAGGELVQNSFHTIIGDTENKGWGYQLDNRPIVNFFADRTWRIPVVNLVSLPFIAPSPVGIDILPDATAFVGTEMIYAQAGATLRIGQGLDNDFGVARIMPGTSGGDAYDQSPGLTWYAFGGADGKVVAYNTLLEGNSFSNTGPSVTEKPVVAEFDVGLAAIYHGVKISYTQVWQTHEFDGQQGGLFEFGSLAVSARF
ncbi:lipid A deacylase LpxR family protein [Acidisoma cladoniae]|jgi:lipid A 3-O-deacylase|uniref:lipid A deacylase LpxR family protein n=1 Tax=Acidisoma cladoniae TaxID=3040935 RepID=UPI00254C14B8|nr:lipid A deacylase LpxR family protein [Acidisoma sp. PAMC 29798]